MNYRKLVTGTAALLVAASFVVTAAGDRELKDLQATGGQVESGVSQGTPAASGDAAATDASGAAAGQTDASTGAATDAGAAAAGDASGATKGE